MKFIGITGGVGAGKSTVLAYLKENYKCHIALADDLAKSLMEPGSICYGALVDLLSPYQVFDGAGRIEKESMARLLFQKKRCAHRSMPLSILRSRNVYWHRSKRREIKAGWTIFSSRQRFF